MKNLQSLLKDSGYKKINFKLSKTQHLLIKAKINGIKGSFILDTGASNSCIGFDVVEHFEIEAKASKNKAAGAGAVGMETQISNQNLLQIGRWKTKNLALVIFDLTHVNLALTQYKAKPVHGIIGADVLLQGKAIIDYYNHCLYLK
ncbi:retropepsin-like aspartic protease [Flavobacterium filum]|uniref:retropepsin-like aspartic protease n=1 Tax=Flavobacterium TaxID=237 RepID=UPI0004116288|nr:retropepsin-like aspartic protease [Flavobacterium filum]